MTLLQTQRQNRASGVSDTHYPAHFDLSAISILIRCPIWNLRRIQCTIMSFISICHPHHVRSSNKIADALVCGLFVDAFYEVRHWVPVKSYLLFSCSAQNGVLTVLSCRMTHKLPGNLNDKEVAAK